MGWVVNATPRPVLLPGKTRHPLYRGLGRPQGRSGRVRKTSPPPGFDPRTVQPVVSSYTDWAILAHTTSWGVSVNWLQTSVFWDVTPCSLGYKYWWFGYADIHVCRVEGPLVFRYHTAITLYHRMPCVNSEHHTNLKHLKFNSWFHIYPTTTPLMADVKYNVFFYPSFLCLCFFPVSPTSFPVM
jgi:hypothetical protein